MEPSLLDNTTSMQSNNDNNDQNGDKIEDMAEIEIEHFVCFTQKLAPSKNNCMFYNSESNITV